MSNGPEAANDDQIEFWNEAGGKMWSAHRARLTRQIEPMGRAAMARLEAAPGHRVLDVGCGCGETSIALARAVGPQGSVLGFDASEPLLALARADAQAAGLSNLSFQQGDAQTAAFEPASFDRIFSRFGVMFFADPVAAFANLRRALKPGGRLAFVCWRAPIENPLMSAPLMAAEPLLPPLPPPDPFAPGPFAFADGQRTARILADAGFADPKVERFDTTFGDEPLEESLQAALGMGPLAFALRTMEVDEATRARVAGVVRETLAAFLTPDGIVQAPAACWIVSANA